MLLKQNIYIYQGKRDLKKKIALSKTILLNQVIEEEVTVHK